MSGGGAGWTRPRSHSTIASDARLPFGGIKDSGYGRELSRHGIQEFASSPAGIAGEVASLLVMIVGIVVLARHAPAVTRQLQEAGDSSQGSAARLRHRG